MNHCVSVLVYFRVVIAADLVHQRDCHGLSSTSFERFTLIILTGARYLTATEDAQHTVNAFHVCNASVTRLHAFSLSLRPTVTPSMIAMRSHATITRPR